METQLQRILVVDDEPANITLMGNIFEGSYDIFVAMDGEDGLRIARSLPPPDIILLDIMMPGMDGYEVCRILQADARTCEIPIIFVTALSASDDENKGLSLGAVDYISKPFNNAIVKARVRTHLHLKRQRDQLLEQRQELDRSHQLNLMILATASDGIFGIDNESTITFINPAALQMIGYREEDVLGKNSCQIMHHTKPDGSKRPLSECLACQAMLTGESLEIHQDLYWRKNHTSFPVAFSVAPAFKGDAIVGAVIVFKDITRRQQLEQELYGADKLEAFQVLAGGIAHDFNNLLTIIVGNLDMALWEEDLDSEVKECLLPCKDAAMMATALAEKFHTIASRGITPFTSTIDIRAVINQVLSALPSDLHIDCNVLIPVNAWSLQADVVQFLQLFKNIIANACEAMPGGGKITIRVENCPDCSQKYSTLSEDKYLLFSIRDQGCGIPEEEKKKIFDPYFSTKDRGNKKGMGLGLTICNAIMQKHHGLIELDQKTEEGTTVNLFFPVTGTVT